MQLLLSYRKVCHQRKLSALLKKKRRKKRKKAANIARVIKMLSDARANEVYDRMAAIVSNSICDHGASAGSLWVNIVAPMAKSKYS